MILSYLIQAILFETNAVQVYNLRRAIFPPLNSAMYIINFIHTAMYNSNAVSTRAHQISTDPLCIPSKMSFNVLYNINHMQLQLASLYIYIIMRVYSYLLMVTVAMLVGVAGNTVLVNHGHHLAYRVAVTPWLVS